MDFKKVIRNFEKTSKIIIDVHEPKNKKEFDKMYKVVTEIIEKNQDFETAKKAIYNTIITALIEQGKSCEWLKDGGLSEQIELQFAICFFKEMFKNI